MVKYRFRSPWMPILLKVAELMQTTKLRCTPRVIVGGSLVTLKLPSFNILYCFQAAFSLNHVQYQAISSCSKSRGCNQAWTTPSTPTQQNCSSPEAGRCTGGGCMKTEVAAWICIWFCFLKLYLELSVQEKSKEESTFEWMCDVMILKSSSQK